MSSAPPGERDRVALITGGTRNIGLAVSEALAALGHRVILVFRSNERQARAAVDRLDAVGADVRAVRADVSHEGDVVRLFGDLRATEGRLDVLVNNVGDFLFKPFLETTLEEWDTVLRSNLTSAFLCAREAVPLMRSQRSGSIVSIASMHADVLRAVPNTLPYAVAKTGIILLTKSLAKMEAGNGIRVNAVCPGYVESSQHGPSNPQGAIPIGRPARAAEIANVVAFLASERASYVTGAVVNVHGGALL